MDLFSPVLMAVVKELARRLGLKLPSDVRIQAGVLGVKLSLVDPQKTVDDRLARIETARQGLAEALEAMDELKQQAEENKEDLARLKASIEKASHEKLALDAELEALKEISSIDTQSVRKIIGVQSTADKWVERLIGFAFGIGASVVATIVWEFVLKRIMT
jgi:hypothetical protein